MFYTISSVSVGFVRCKFADVYVANAVKISFKVYCMFCFGVDALEMFVTISLFVVLIIERIHLKRNCTPFNLINSFERVILTVFFFLERQY